MNFDFLIAGCIDLIQKMNITLITSEIINAVTLIGPESSQKGQKIVKL